MSAAGIFLPDVEVLAPAPRVDALVGTAWQREVLARLSARHALTPRRCAHGECIFQAGDPFQLLYVLRSGAVKLRTFAADEPAHEHVAGFRLPGEWLGIKAIGRSMYTFDAIALGDCNLWEFPYRAVLDACAGSEALCAGLAHLRAMQTRHDRSWILRTTTVDADAVVAAFLRDVSERCQAYGAAPERFGLAASSEEIASFLGMDVRVAESALQRCAMGCAR